MALFILSAILSLLALGGPSFAAEKQLFPDPHFSLKTTLLPSPSLDSQKLELEVDQAIAEMIARKRDEELIRELLAPPRRPDLTYDVTTGIQGHALDNALRHR